MFPSRGKKKKRGGRKRLLVQADEENKQFQIWFLLEVKTRVEARLSPSTSNPAFSPSSSSSPLPSICSFCERLSSHFDASVFPSFLLTDGGRSTPSQLGDSDFPATSPPPSPQARGYKSSNPLHTSLRNWFKEARFRAAFRPTTPSREKNPQPLMWFICSARLLCVCVCERLEM